MTSKLGYGHNSPTMEDLKPSMNTSDTGPTNPFRILKKDRDQQQQLHAGSNLEVKRVKYQHKNTSPNNDEKSSPPTDDQKEFVRMVGSTSSFAAGQQDS